MAVFRSSVPRLVLPVLMIGLGAFMGCDDSGESLPSPTPDAAPIVTILKPLAGESLYPGAGPFFFNGLVSDDVDNEQFLQTQFLLIKDGVEGAPFAVNPDATGAVLWQVAYLEEGSYVLKLSAVDSSGLEGVAEAAFAVHNEPPTVEISSPLPGDLVDQGKVLTVSGIVTDLDQPSGRGFDVRLLVNGTENQASFTLEDGSLSFSYVPEVEGALELGVKAIDELGGEHTATVTLTVKPCVDVDLDGYFTCPKNNLEADCNDADSSAHPGVAERCNGQDDDCNGQISADELDQDADSYSPCEGDCNDADETIYSGARELCDGIDNDCDGLLPVLENDGDGDGYRGCAADGLDADCDDAVYAVHPGAEELCDGLDDNCDEVLLDDEHDEDTDGWLLCEGDCNDTNFYTFPGAPERLDWQDNNCDGNPEVVLTLSAAQGRYDGTQTDGQAGFSVAVGEDVNGDGIGDLLVGAPRFSGATSTGGSRGGAFLIFGRSSGWKAQEAGLLSKGIVVHSEELNARFGSSVSLVGDMNGDKLGDLMVGAPGHTVNNQADAGAVYLIAGRKDWANAEIGSVTLTAVEGSSGSMLMGTSISGQGDVNGDGVMDVVMGAPWTSRRPSATGLLAVLSARSLGWSSRTALNTLVRIMGTDSNAIGTSVAMIEGSGDSFDDLAVGGLGTTSSPPGVLFWVPGSASLRGATQTTVTSLNARYYQGDTANERVASSVASGADVDGDGLNDFLAGRAMDGSSGDAAAYLMFGGQNPPTSGQLEKSAQVRFMRGPADECPCAVAGLADFNGDGLGDIAIGVSRTNGNGADSGAVYVFLGRSGRSQWPASLSLDGADGILVGETEKDQVGYSLASGDLNLDGASDLVIGAPLASGRDERGNLYPSAGRVYVVLGTTGG